MYFEKYFLVENEIVIKFSIKLKFEIWIYLGYFSKKKKIPPFLTGFSYTRSLIVSGNNSESERWGCSGRHCR